MGGFQGERKEAFRDEESGGLTRCLGLLYWR